MARKSFGKFSAQYMILFGLVGLCIGGILFILEVAGVDIAIVIGTTSYEGTTAGLIFLIGAPIILVLLGFVISLFTYSWSRR